ncbi:putative cyclin-dependent kinase 9, partial [Trichinella nativa]
LGISKNNPCSRITVIDLEQFITQFSIVELFPRCYCYYYRRLVVESTMASQSLVKYLEDCTFPYIADVNKYEKIIKIGQGTFGEVFKARDRKTGKIVALKKILMENEKEGFPITAIREIRILQKVRHQNVTELLELVPIIEADLHFTWCSLSANMT